MMTLSSTLQFDVISNLLLMAIAFLYLPFCNFLVWFLPVSLAYGPVILCMIGFPDKAVPSFSSWNSVGSWSHQFIMICLLCVLVHRHICYFWACPCLPKLIKSMYFICHYYIYSQGEEWLVESNSPWCHLTRKSCSF